MADSLFLSLWFQDFETDEMLPHALRLMQQFSFSKSEPGIANVVLNPISWEQPTILERRFHPGVAPEVAVLVAVDLLHADYAYVFEASWDLWSPQTSDGEWTQRPALVKFIARGEEFEGGEAEVEGQLQVDFGVDTPFLHEELELTGDVESRVRANVQALVDFINRVEKNVGAATRLLWSESDENLAQKLITRLQKVQ
ncbi:MAG TPA: hypothetical protein VGU90_09215 [Terriglobales bacterium]|nr:hypothetical protein [Terriglobales bacterium]